MAEARISKAPETLTSDILSAEHWNPISVPSGDVFGTKPNFAWFKSLITELPKTSPDEVPALYFGGVDDNAVVYLNGKRIARHQGCGEPFDISLESARLNKQATNEIVVLVENTGGGGGIGSAVYLHALSRKAFVPPPAQDNYDASKWRAVRLPHDYVIEGEFSEKGSNSGLVKPRGWYRREFDLPTDWRGKTLWLDFDGLFRDSKVWLNGQYLGNHKSGYIGVSYDISKSANYGGRNILAVHLDPSAHEGWWYEGGGIYRHVWLNVANALHITPQSLFVKPRVEDPQADRPTAKLEILASVRNDGDKAQTCKALFDVVDPSGKVAATLSSQLDNVQPGETRDLALNAGIANARLWSIEKPNLYKLVARIEQRSEIVDEAWASFGLRTLRFDPDEGFFLNEKHVKIKGTCNHMDFAGIGVALADNFHEWRIRKLQEVGCNAWRTSHNPVNPEMLDACDRLGMLVLNETRHFGDAQGMKTPLGTPCDDLSELISMVRRDRNHPSVIAWSIANEEVKIENTPEGENIGQAMKDIIYQLDGTRPVTAGVVEHFAGYPKLSKVLDIEGFNYGPPQNYDRYRTLHPKTPQLATEITSALATRGEYACEPFFIKKSDLVHLPLEFWGDEKRGFMNGLGLSSDRGHATSTSWKPVAERPFVAGGFVWTGFDYKGECHPFAWPNISSQFGFMDTCGFPKDDYYYYKAWWGNEPCVQIVPHWNWPKDKGVVKVMVHGNCERVELFLNGKSLGMKDMPRYLYLSWDVNYAPGTLEAKGYNGAKRVATSKVETVGDARKLSLSATPLEFVADNQSQYPIAVSVLDSQGRVVVGADNEIEFSVIGNARIAGVGNGDPSSHEPDKSNRRKAFHGLCMVIIEATGEPGKIIVRAESGNLKSADLKLRSRPSGIKELK